MLAEYAGGGAVGTFWKATEDVPDAEQDAAVDGVALPGEAGLAAKVKNT